MCIHKTVDLNKSGSFGFIQKLLCVGESGRLTSVIEKISNTGMLQEVLVIREFQDVLSKCNHIIPSKIIDGRLFMFEGYGSLFDLLHIYENLKSMSQNKLLIV